MKRINKRLVLAASAMAIAIANSTYAQEMILLDSDAKAKNADTRYIRLKRDSEKTPIALQTATARFVSETGFSDLIVDLVGVVHIGDKKYYNEFNKQFKDYDVVLYELVAPKGTRVPRGGKPTGMNPISMLQGMTQSSLGLQSQMDHIDYTAKNFVHADMSPEDMAAAMRERGDTPVTFFLSAAADLLRESNKKAQQMEAKAEAARQAGQQVEPAADPISDLFSMLTDSKASGKMKVQMAEQFDSMSGAMGGALGSTLNQTIVKDRNKAALRVLQKEIVKGRKKIAIFYGAAHMPDFEKRLNDDFGLKRSKTTWQTAWDLVEDDEAAPTKSESPLSMMLRMLQEQQ
ncbi:MAG: hypothetical protein AAF497_19945 [Planctomycetota bacterium]